MNAVPNQTVIEDDGCPWYAVRLFSLKQQEVANAFQEKGIQYFIPDESQIEAMIRLIE